MKIICLFVTVYVICVCEDRAVVFSFLLSCYGMGCCKLNPLPDYIWGNYSVLALQGNLKSKSGFVIFIFTIWLILSKLSSNLVHSIALYLLKCTE